MEPRQTVSGEKIEVAYVMALCVDKEGKMYVEWNPGAPPQFKAQMKAQFGAFFTELAPR